MTAKNLQNIELNLVDTGFSELSPEIFAWNAEPDSWQGSSELPWQIQDWVLAVAESDRLKNRFTATLLHEYMLANFVALMREKFPAFRAASLHPDQQSGYWLLFEFCDPVLEADQSRLIEEESLKTEQLPHGLAGLHLSMIVSLAQLSVYMTKHFLLGNVPGSIFIEIPRIIAQASFGLSLKEHYSYNAYTCTIASEVLRHALIDASGVPELLLPTLHHKFIAEHQPMIRQAKAAWTLAWELTQELPELVIPPIEVLEQKEVSKRFHRLDEMIRDENYEGALKQCSEYLAKFPQSLYLIRRLSFLSLWASRPLEKPYLELMAKYDPLNLMTISLSIRLSLLENQTIALLEHLSKLGHQLGHAIEGFDSAQISSLTLPEMLGDAWNLTDDQRAVDCYERVLQSRGEVPRILVKLIRLMRDLGHASAEEAYMDRLLACEVPVRTRAAIYFRLAEIKESIDLDEAAHWALKSWQTNRSHVRFALLAAKLLIALKRSHEAVHVLVETSEQLAAQETVATRLDLELQIASIWLYQLQRYDLAAERLCRARELADEDPLAFERMAEIAAQLGDQSQHVDLLLLTFDSAVKAADKTRIELSVHSLMNVAKSIPEPAKRGKIYSAILMHHLIDADLIAAIIDQAELNLPFAKILAAMDSLVADVAPAEQGRYYELMGAISHRFLNHPEQARGYYEKVLHSPYQGQAAFEYLDETYARLGLNEERYRLLKRRYELAPAIEKTTILRELYYFDEGIGESERDGYALQIFLADADDVRPLEERISVYEQQGAIQSIRSLLSQVIASAKDSGALLKLLQLGARAINSGQQSDRFACLHPILVKMAELQKDRLATAKLGLFYFWPDPQKSYVAEHLEYLIAQGEIPDYDPDEMLAALSDKKPKIELLMHLSGFVSENRAIGYLRRALRLARSLAMPFAIKQGIMQKLASLTVLQQDELDEYIRHGREAGEHGLLLTIINHQLALAQDNTTRGELCTLACDFLLAESVDEAVLDGICKAIGILPVGQQVPLKCRWLEARGFESRLHTREFALEFLAHVSNWEKRVATEELLKRLISEWQERPAATALVQNALQAFMDAQQDELLDSYLTFLGALGLVSESTAYMAFEAFAKKQDQPRAERYFKEAMAQQIKAELAEKWLKSAQELLVSLDMPQIFQSVLTDLLDPHKQHSLVPEVQREISIFYARWQVLQGRELRKALSTLEQLHAIDQMDPRIWSPLIVLYREFNADTDLYELLYRAMPILRANPDLLRPFPLDLQSLEADLTTMGQRLGLMREQTNVNNFLGDLQFPNEISTLQELVGPHGTAVVLPSDPRKRSTIASESLMVPPSFTQGSNVNPFMSDGDSAPGDPSQKDLSVSNFIYRSPTDQATSTHLLTLPVSKDDLTQTNILTRTQNSFDVDERDQSDSAYTLPVLPPKPMESPPTGMPPELPRVSRDSAIALPPPPPDDDVQDRKAYLLFEPDEWRVVASQARAKDGLCKWLLQHPFTDKVEQHVAVQVAAIFEEKLALLDKWGHRVWRYPQELFYEMRWSERMGREMFHPGMKSPLAKLLKALHPLIQTQFAASSGIKSIAERMKIRPEDLQRVRKPIEWNDECLQRGNIRYYTKYFTEAGYRIFNFAKLDDRIHFDYEQREIYFDREYYLAVPASHLFHRLSFLSRAVQLEYYTFLHLSPNHDIYPFLMKCRRSLEQNRMDNVRRMFGIEKDPMKLILSQIDREQLEQLFVEVGTLSPDKIAKISSVFVEQIYRINIAESLDLIGLLETVSNVNLIESTVSPLSVISQSPLLRSLIAFTADLKFGQSGK